MRKIIYITLLFLLNSNISNSQDNACDGERYKDKIFLNTETTYNITFGSATTLGGNENSLEMDIYQPVGDDFENRPVVILAFGGSFIVGDRNDMAPFCADLARRGFVTATIDYRLIDTFVFDSIAVSEEIVMAASDMKAAIRYLRNDAQNENTYGIDPDKIFVGGISAGAITACHAAYLGEDDDIPTYVQELLDAHGGIEGESNDETLGVSSHVSGVLNYSGGLGRDHWLDWNDAPIFSAHDDLDNVVVCGYGSSEAFFFELFGYGGCSLTDRAIEVGQYSEFYLKEESEGHVSYFTDAGEFIEVMALSAEFLEFIVCGYVGVDEESISNFNIYPNPGSGKFQIDNLHPAIDSYVIYNSTGVRMNSGRVSGDILSLPNLSTGLYHIQFTSAIDKTFPKVTKRIIIE